MPKALTIEEKRERNMSQVEVKETTAREQGRTRTRAVFNGTRGKLDVDVSKLIEAGYHPHIFNDEPGRIQQALDGGYEFVTPEEVGGLPENVVSRNTDITTDKVRFLVGSENGEGLYAYLLKIKQDWYEEDQRDLQKRNDATDAAIKRGKGGSNDTTGFYDAGTKIQT